MTDKPWTPGPWHITDCPCGHPRCNDKHISSGKFCQGSGFDPDTANLVAAAPDLVEALEKIEPYLEAQDLREIAESALAKAYGKEPNDD